MVTISASSHIIEVEAFGKRHRCSPFTADHHIMAWLIPEVIVVVHAIRILFPMADNVKPLIQQEKSSGTIATLVTEHRDHNGTISQTVHGMGCTEIRLFLDVFRFDDCMQLWCPFIRNVQDVNAAGEKSRHNQKTTRFAFISMTGATGIPPKVMQFITL